MTTQTPSSSPSHVPFGCFQWVLIVILFFLLWRQPEKQALTDAEIE
jgi:hypothetical protein